MFTGSIQAFTRSRISEMSANWTGRKVYVACSGNFTVERLLSLQPGIAAIHSNDVSIYSCALGACLTGKLFPIQVKSSDPKYAFLQGYLGDALSVTATLMLCTDWLKISDKQGAYFDRMNANFLRSWKARHTETMERIKKATEGTRVSSYFAGDCVEFLEQADKDSVAISFPPTYKGGYERLYRKFEEVFAWQQPSYEIFTQERFDRFEKALFAFRTWMTLTDYDRETLRGYCVGVNQTSLRSKPVYTYCNEGAGKIAFPHQRVGQLPRPICSEEVSCSGILAISAIKPDVMNALRSLFLDPYIAPALPQYNFAVLYEGKIVGAVGVSSPTMLGNFCDVYIMSDFAVRPNPHKRLSKLILAAILSTDFKEWLEQLMGRRLSVIGTTAFTNNAVSMKYRGLFDLYSRKEGKQGEKNKLNYTAEMGRWSLKEGFDWWLEKHAKHRLSA